MNTIIGAGLAGLIAAHAWPRATIVEASPQPTVNHRALLRFRTDAVARLTGIEFRQVRVHKGIVLEGEFVGPSIRAANLYARKVLGHAKGDRSIWNLAPVDRYIAPDTLYEQLVESAADRIVWNTKATFQSNDAQHKVVSTAPLPVTLRAVGIEPGAEFCRAGIRVMRWRVPGVELFQTIYFPGDETPVYRASFTGDTLIAELVEGQDIDEVDVLIDLGAAFGLHVMEADPLGEVKQTYGKIQPISDAARKELLFRLTHEHGIYSLGRFATWRNILLDDVVDDISVIKRLSHADSRYALKIATQ
jgi:hypothetical protein